MCWAIALGKHLNAQVRWNRPVEDPPDAEFCIQERDGTEVTVWGELAGTYYNSNEAGWLWGAQTGKGKRGGIYWEPDAVVGTKARELVERKSKKYAQLVQRRGLGHLLTLLHSPLTSRSTRIEAEGRIRELLESTPSLESVPFETVWLGYRLPNTTTDEQEDPRDVFQDPTDKERFNFLKCIWTRPEP